MRCLAIIPARMHSTRLPGKPLKDIAGKPLIQRVWEQARAACEVGRLIIATDDQQIHNVCLGFGAEVMMTSAHHVSGSDRVAEAWLTLEQQGEHYDLVANIQGDMPFIQPEVIDQAIGLLARSPKEIGMTTVATPILSESEFERASVVKIVLGKEHEALYFSRAAIPFVRNKSEVSPGVEEPWGYKHIGLYIFRPETLRSLSSFAPCIPEKREGLEQLRALCHGIRIRVAVVTEELMKPSIEVDTEEDLARAREYARG